MTPYCQHGGIACFLGDSRDIVPALGLFDACVTDPPYELGFMGRKWDASGIAYDVTLWRKVFDALKPGAHLLAFGGTRTYHRMTCAIEDAGFEIRDCIQWIYGSGFPKSLDVSKAIDRAAGAEREVVGPNPTWREAKRENKIMEPVRGGGAEVLTAPTTDAAKQWDGWGTALKPANEPIVLARKPLSEGTVAGNVLAHGTGALNIDGCRVGDNPCYKYRADANGTIFHGDQGERIKQTAEKKGAEFIESTQGRWPANLIHDGSEEVLALFPQSSVTGARSSDSKAAIVGGTDWLTNNHQSTEYTDSGSAARFFYCAKASKDDRGEGNTHATVKPVTLMRYLCRLVTPPGGRIIDPFAGSGTTLVAARIEGFNAAGVDLEQGHVEISRQRICSIKQEVLAL